MSARRLDRQVRPPRRQEGQALPLFLVMIFVIIGAAAIVTDVSWFWVSQQRMQRAADAASLAGAVFMPGNLPGAYAAALDAATLNGFTTGINGVIVTPAKDLSNNRRLIVTVSGPVDTMLGRIFNEAAFNRAGTEKTKEDASVRSEAEYVMPVPMGSPQNYYGVGYYVGATTTSGPSATTSRRQPPAITPTASWMTPANAYGAGLASAAANNAAQQWGNFNYQTYVPNDATLAVEGIQVRMTGVDLSGTGNSTCILKAELSWNGGTTWATSQNTTTLSTSPISLDVGSATTMTAWGAHSWMYADFSNTNFRIQLTWTNGPLTTSPCSTTQKVDVDDVDVEVYWHTITTTSTWGVKPVLPPGGGAALVPQNFWAAMQGQGAPSIQGDAFMTKYQTRTSAINPAYDYEGYYNYGVDMPVGAASGQVWIFDPGFCDVGSGYGTGENWTQGAPNGATTVEPISAFYEIWDTRNTPYDTSDDIRKDATADDTDYRRLKLSDTDQQPASPAVPYKARATDTTGAAVTQCTDLAWHNGWVQIADDLPGATTYRLHTFSTDAGSLTDQNDSTALNAFAVWATANGGTPRVYGIGAMEAYVRVPAATVSEFYLAQVDVAHAGKTLVIELWDPGDTGALPATLQILAPNATDYAATNFTWASTAGTTNSGVSACAGRTSAGLVTSVVTNPGNSPQFNGCWVTITIALPNAYTAPHPLADTVTTESGWWKIRYSIGSGSGSATDLTTWKVSIRGSPVHLVH